MYSWEDLAGLALARQFPDIAGRDVDAVAEALHLIGPIQAQTARSPFLGLAARMPGVTLETISAAYDDHRIVRGSNIRGTVHTSTPEDSPLLEVATRIGQRTLWQRTLKLERTTLEDVWAGIEDFARDEWRTPAELSTHLSAWLREHDPDAGATLDNEAGRYFGFGHGGLIRRPLKGGWQAQGQPGLPHRVGRARRPTDRARRSRRRDRRAGAPAHREPRPLQPPRPRLVGGRRAARRRRLAGSTGR